MINGRQKFNTDIKKKQKTTRYYTKKGPGAPHEKICKHCSQEFLSTRSNQVFCCIECRSRHEKGFVMGVEEKQPLHDPSTSTPKIGAIHELVVCVDLMRKGYDVFRAQSPSCPCDLVCLKGVEMKRVEVRTGRRMDNREEILFFHQKSDRERSDMYAVVLVDGSVVYMSHDFVEIYP